MDLTYFRTDVPETASELFDGELVIAHYGSGLYFSLSVTAALIWQGLRHGLAHDEVATWLSGSLAGDAGAITASVTSFVARLQSEGLVVAVEGPVTLADLPVVAAGAWQEPLLERFDDLQDLLLLDPVHDVSEAGWPHRPDDAGN